MNRFFQKILTFLAVYSICTYMVVSAATAGTLTIAEPLRRPDGFMYGTLNYPVTLCGRVESIAKDKEDHRFLLRNGPLVIFLQIGPGADPYSRQQFSDVKSIFPSSAEGCVHGRGLPVARTDVTVFEVERTSLTIVLGGISVSN